MNKIFLTLKKRLLCMKMPKRLKRSSFILVGNILFWWGIVNTCKWKVVHVINIKLMLIHIKSVNLTNINNQNKRVIWTNIFPSYKQHELYKVSIDTSSQSLRSTGKSRSYSLITALTQVPRNTWWGRCTLLNWC